MRTIERSSLPEECVADCSAPGPVDEAVERWRRKLNFTVTATAADRAAALACVRSSGGWDAEELAASTDEDLARRVLWFACGHFDQEPDSDVYWVEG